MELSGTRFETATDALQWVESCGGCAVMLDEGIFVVSQTEAKRLETAGVDMAFLEFDGEDRIITIPVNG